MDHQEYLGVLETTYPELDQWANAGRTAFIPAVGSEMHEDDQDWPSLPTSQLAHVGLGVAMDHLSAIRCHLDARRLFPFADLTICRSALVGASEAVWVLAPDSRSERLKRARTLAAYALKNHLQYLTALKEFVGDPPDDNTDRVAERVAALKSELAAKREAAGERTKLDTTRMIEQAAGAAFAAPEAGAASLEWQSGSGAAHGLAWSVLGTVDTVQSGPPDESGMAEFQASGSLGRMANGYLAAFHMARHGWRLLELRSTPPNIRNSAAADALRTGGGN